MPTGRNLTLYNATVSGGHLTLTPRTGDYAHKVAKGEAVLIKTDGESVKVDDLGGASGMSPDTNNDLIATPETEQILEAGTNEVFYRLAYKNSANKTGLGFYLSVVKDGTTTRDGSRIKTTPGKGYLKVAKSAATEGSASSPASAFLLGGGGSDDTTDIECITVIDGKTYAIDTHNQRYRLKRRLYELEEELPGCFIRINKSALANEKRLERFTASFNGAVDAVFQCGYTEYVSRRCFAKIRRRFEK